MRILFLCTAHNSLCQRLYLALSRVHDISIEFALSDQAIVSAVALCQPDLIVCPFLTTLVPRQIYEVYLTLIIHPGPPGDVGPSALDWVLMGDDGSVDDAKELIIKLDTEPCAPGRTHWGVTILQAIEHFDAGPVWAFDQFELDIDQSGLTKSELYRGPVTQAAISATWTAISRIEAAAACINAEGRRTSVTKYPATLLANPGFARFSVQSSLPFQGGKLHHRPLLKAAQREFDVSRHTAQHVSRNIRCGDSQPGVLSTVFGPSLYVYGGVVDDNADKRLPTFAGKLPARILGFRSQAVCLATHDGMGVWITHIRRPKTKHDNALWPKVGATSGLLDLGLLTAADIQAFTWPIALDWKLSSARTFQEVWVDMQVDASQKRTAYLYFHFYNGAMSTDQCSRLIEAMDFILHESTSRAPIQAVVLMGGSYFSNGIALNVIEAADDPAQESWFNINRIDDVVHYLLHEFPSRNIITVAAVRGNAAAGGVALATACDVVVAGGGVVLNPAYRTVGLFGSEYHTLSYYGRCGKTNATKILHSMTPISALYAQSIGLVDYIFPGTGSVLEDYIRTHIAYLLRPGILKRGLWKTNVDLSLSALARARTHELGEMSKDFWSARSARYDARRFDFVRKIKPSHTPLRFATHRRRVEPALFDEEESESFDSVEYFHKQFTGSLTKQIVAELNQPIVREDSYETLINGPPTPALEMDLGAVGPPTAAQMKKGDSGFVFSPTQTDKIVETLFPCYYKPLGEGMELMTPPETPSLMIELGASPFGDSSC